MTVAYTLKRPGRALLAGAAIGGCLVSVPFNALDFAANSQFLAVDDMMGRWFWSFAFATFFFGMGLAFVGAPAWMLLDHNGVRGPVAAASLGPALILTLNLLLDLITLQTVAINVGDVLLAGACAVVGLAVQRIAYVEADSIKPPSAQPS